MISQPRREVLALSKWVTGDLHANSTQPFSCLTFDYVETKTANSVLWQSPVFFSDRKQQMFSTEIKQIKNILLFAALLRQI